MKNTLQAVKDVVRAVAAMRGGIPEACSFCHRPFTEERQPFPEEAGDWACSECLIRWSESK